MAIGLPQHPKAGYSNSYMAISHLRLKCTYIKAPLLLNYFYLFGLFST